MSPEIASRPAPSAGPAPSGALLALQELIGHRFADAALLQQALVHRSYLNEHPERPLESNERLEFLGDAVLDAVISRRLFEDYPHAGEGWLTEVRSRLVRNDTLGERALAYDLGRFLVMGRGVDVQGGRERPAVLGRAFEAVIGAVYLDGGWRAARRFILRALAEELQYIAVAGLRRDPKSLLQQACQARWHATPVYTTVEESGPAHERQFRVEVHLDGELLGDGGGASKQTAEMAAAERALQRLPEEALP